MKQQSVVIVYLSLSLFVLQWMYLKSEKHNAYLQGKQAVYDAMAASTEDGTCYALNNNCVDNPNNR